MINLYNGDCLEIMKNIADKSIDLVLTDPPYLLSNHKGQELTNTKFGRTLATKDNLDPICNDFKFEAIANEWIRICKKLNLFIFCSNAQVSRTMKFFEDKKKYSVTLLIWNKTNPIPLCNGKYVSNLEFIVCVREKGSHWNNILTAKEKYKTFNYPTVTAHRIHPAQKPIILIERLLKLKSFENDLILDCFMGSGTTGVACKNLNRNFIGIELDENYFNIARERIENHTRQLELKCQMKN